MPRFFPALVAVVVCLTTGFVFRPVTALSRTPAPQAAQPSPSQPPRVRFETNVGQADSSADFIARGPRYALLLSPQAAALRLAGPTHSVQPPRFPVGTPSLGACECRTSGDAPVATVVRFALEGSNPHAHGTGAVPDSSRMSYFLGSDRSKWRSNVPAFERVTYRDVYPGIDVVYHGGEAGELEYDFDVAPGADPARIALRIAGTDCVSIDATGDLVLSTPSGELRQRHPVVYQGEGTARRMVTGDFEVRPDGAIGFRIAGYDRSATLVIDPIISYSTYLGGSDADRGETTAVGPDGSIYLAGSTMSLDFPTSVATPGGPPGSLDMFVTKFNPAGTGLDFSVILGGSEDDIPAILKVDAAGNVTVRGITHSGNFPVHNAAQATFGGDQDVVLFKLSPDGSALQYSTYIGGSRLDDCYTGLDIDAAGNAYVAGCTNSADFPVKNAFQPTYTATQFNIGFFAKYSPTGAQIFSSYFGGSYSESIYGVIANPDGSISVGGTAFSTDLPLMNPIQSTLNGGSDGFVAKIKSDGSGLIFSTYYGGSGDDLFGRIAGDSLGAIYATGFTTSVDYPTVHPFQAANAGGFYDSLVTKFNPDGRSIAYASYLGGSLEEIGYGIAVDGLGVAHVQGYTKSTDFPTVDPIQSQYAGGTYDITVTTVSADGSTLLFSTYLGGSGLDFTNDSICDVDGNVYVSVYTDSTDFPTVTPYQAVYAGGDRDAAVLKISNRYELTWDPPTADGGAPEHLAATLAEGVVGGGGARPESPTRPREITGYNVYRSTSQSVQPTPANLFMQLPPTQTTTGPTAPGGSFFVVTATFGTTESGASNEASAGDGGGATLSKVKVKAAKISAKGMGFSSAVAVFLDGIPFATPAVVKKGTKVTQTGTLLTGETIGQYLGAHGNRAIVAFRNANGGVVTYTK